MHWGTLTQVIWKGITHLHFPVIARYCDVVPDSYELYFNDSSNVLHFTSRTFKLTPESLLSKAGHIIWILCASKLTTSSACMSVFCYYSSIVYTETDAFPLVALCFGIYSITVESLMRWAARGPYGRLSVPHCLSPISNLPVADSVLTWQIPYWQTETSNTLRFSNADKENRTSQQTSKGNKTKKINLTQVLSSQTAAKNMIKGCGI